MYYFSKIWIPIVITIKGENMILKIKTKKYVAIQVYQPPPWELKAFGKKNMREKVSFL